VTQVNTALVTYHPFVSRDNPDAALINLGLIDFQRDSQFQFQVQAVTPLQRLKYSIQSVYLDASAITTGFTSLSIDVTGQMVSIAPGYQGYRTLLCNPGSQVFTLSNAAANSAGGSQIIQVIFMNVPVVGVQWGASPNAVASALWG
jgi:hypothetical protein